MNMSNTNIGHLIKNLSVIGNGQIGSQNKASGQLLGGSWKSLVESDAYVKRYEVLELSEDLLALSACWKRLRDEGNSFGISRLTDEALFHRTASEDREKAALIRDYYSKKIMMLKIKSTELTSFRRDLNEFVHNDGRKIREHMLPLAYRLPEFYEYDAKFETFATDLNRKLVGYDTKSAHHTATLSFIEKLIVNTSRQKRTEYWFKDNNNNLVVMTYDISNPLLSLLDNVVTTQNIKLSGSFIKRIRDDREYLNLTRCKFV